jgi:hypothetical protein
MHGGLSFFGLAANLEVVLLIDEKCEPLSHEWMIVDNEDGLFGSLHRSVKNEIRRHSLSPLSERMPMGTYMRRLFRVAG